MHRLLVDAGAGALISLAGVGSVAPALAHASLSRAVPAAGRTVVKPPTEVDCFFTEELEPSFSSLEVMDAAGKRVVPGTLHASPNDATEVVVVAAISDPEPTR